MEITDYPKGRSGRTRLGLIHYKDEGGERHLVNLTKDVFTIGRTRDNDLAIDHHLISRYHAEVVFDGRSYTYIDKRSRGGSFASDERISEKSLCDGDTIHLGSQERGASLTFYFPQLGDEGEAAHLPRPQPPNHAELAALPAMGRSFAGKTHAEGVGSTVSLAALNQASRKLLACANRAELVEQLLRDLESLLPVARLAALLYDAEQQELRLCASRAASPEASSAQPPEEIIAQVCAQNAVRAGYDHQRRQFYLCAPLASACHVWGVCYLIAGERAFSREEMDFLAALGQQAGLALEALHQTAEQRRTCESLIHALALSIDARDELTAGHSARVAAYAAAIARYLDLPPHEQRVTYYAALLHDYGKIGIRDAVLCKPAQLTPDEYEQIKQHPLYTMKILSKIHFGQDLAAVPLIASSHHERPDGRGYPRGLTRAEIPIGARIIAVADFFDALTSERHYRQPMPLGEVLALIEGGRDTQFDGAVIDAFLSYYHAEYAPRAARRAAC
jgi:HD-GYP domain-containing protein (c-di-GMP phosphodiesterase class II)